MTTSGDTHTVVDGRDKLVDVDTQLARLWTPFNGIVVVHARSWPCSTGAGIRAREDPVGAISCLVVSLLLLSSARAVRASAGGVEAAGTPVSDVVEIARRTCPVPASKPLEDTMLVAGAIKAFFIVFGSMAVREANEIGSNVAWL